MVALSTRIVFIIMPLYSFICDKCGSLFEMIYSYQQYDKAKNTIKCISCGSKHVSRDMYDMQTLNMSVKKSDSELKTLGDIAMRNTERMSDDQKHSLHNKHNDYKDKENIKPLPKGMSRMKKSKNKTKWY